jgi:hypothetical protein
MLRADYERRAGIAAGYREAAGITNPYQGVSPEPHHGNPELENMRREVIHELEYPDEAAMWAGMDRGQLEAHTAAAERAHAAAPPDVSVGLRATAHAEADARQQAADAQAVADETEAKNAGQLADLLATQRQQLETQNTQHEQWADGTRTVRENGDKAAAELNRRGHQADITQDGSVSRAEPQPQQHADSEPEPVGWVSFQTRPQPAPEPQTTLEWLLQFEADMAAVERSVEREHQAAVDAGQPWPPARQPDADHGTTPETELSATGPAARITEAITDVEQAARQYADEQASRQALSDYAARITRQAEAQPEAHAALTAEAPADAEIEL